MIRTDPPTWTAKAGDGAAFEAVAHRYQWLIRSRARSFFLQGADYEDLIQEGMIGLFKAVRDFRQNGSTFRTFAELCITRQIITAIKSASRQKHAPLNAASSVETPRFDGDQGRTLGDTLGDRSIAFDSALLETQEVRSILAILKQRLSSFEYRALILWLQGQSYDEIARRSPRVWLLKNNTKQRRIPATTAWLAKHRQPGKGQA